MEVSTAVARRFGQNLRRERDRACLSQEQLGLAAGLHRTEIGLLERGARVPRIDTVLKLAGGLEIASDVLIAGIEWAPGSAEAGAFVLFSPAEDDAPATRDDSPHA